MTQEEFDAAVNKLIARANEQSGEAKAEYDEDCLAAKFGAMERRTLRSSILQNALDELKAAYDALVLKIQEELDESLAALYAEEGITGPPGTDPGDAPYEVDYTLTMRDRYVIVKDYYLAYEDKAQALADLREDDVAKDYLGNFYDYLLQLLLLMQE